MISNPDCDSGYVVYELAYDDPQCGFTDTGEEAWEGIVCTPPHETCAANCPIQQGKEYSPPKPLMETDPLDQWVYWFEYDEEEPYTNQCTNSCVNGYTDVLTYEMGGMSGSYRYNCAVY